jgi:hypothetical protein
MTKLVGAVGSSFVYETPKGLNGPTGPVSAVPELPVTAEMIAAGLAAFMDVPGTDWNDLAPAIYRAMAAKAPDRLPPVFMGTYGALTNIRPEPGYFMSCGLDEARARIAALEAELMAALEAALASLRSAFSDPAPTDLPDPPRRPDGTLVPQPKPWTPPKDREPPRRVGG